MQYDVPRQSRPLSRLCYQVGARGALANSKQLPKGGRGKARLSMCLPERLECATRVCMDPLVATSWEGFEVCRARYCSLLSFLFFFFFLVGGTRPQRRNASRVSTAGTHPE